MKTVLISGGSSGFGKALAQHLHGTYNVVILARDPDKTTEAAKEIGCDYVIADVTRNEEIERAVSDVLTRHKTIDILINNAGLWVQDALETNDPQKIVDVVSVNTIGTMLLTRAVLPHMKEAKSGRVINVISQAGLHPKAERAVYNGSKWAITGFTQSLQLELTGSGVLVSGLYPGSMNTQLFEHAGNTRDTSKYMDVKEVVRGVDFILQTPEDILVTEVGMKPAWY